MARLAALLWLAVGGANAHDAPLWPYLPSHARAFAALTQASYCGQDSRLLNWTCEPCEAAGFHVVPGTVRFVERRELFQPNSTFVYLARIVSSTAAGVSKHGCVLAFRGSSTATNWIRDLQFWGRHTAFDWCEGCFVEDGWYTILKNIHDELMGQMKDIGCVPENQTTQGGDTTSNLHITGHSLGASLATLAMCLFEEEGFNVRLSYNYESPRVGNQVFTSVFDKVFSRKIPVYRITHGRDPVPHLPPRSLLFYEYSHVNYEVWYPEHGTDWMLCVEQESPECANRYNLFQVATHANQHCLSALAVGGDICQCPVPDAPRETLVV